MAQRGAMILAAGVILFAGCTTADATRDDAGPAGTMDAPPADAGPLMAPGEYYEAFVAATRTATERCWTDPWHTGAIDVDYAWPRGAGHEIDAMVASGDVVFDAQAAAACLAALAAFECATDDPWSLQGRVRSIPACLHAFTGTHPAESTCTANVECIDHWCNTNYGCPGFCMPGASSDAWVAPDAGPPIDVGPIDAAVVSYCLDQPSPTCVDPQLTAQEGDVCATADGVLCAPGLVCGYDEFFTQTHHCELPYERDGRCHHAVPEGCPVGQICDGTLCVDLPGEGETCLLAGNDRYVCATGLGCSQVPTDAGWTQTCRRVAAEGAACGADGLCAGDSWCGRDAVCVVPTIRQCAPYVPPDVGPISFPDSGGIDS